MNHAPPRPFYRITSPQVLSDGQIANVERGLQKEFAAEYLYVGEEYTREKTVVTIFERNWRKDTHHV